MACGHKANFTRNPFKDYEQRADDLAQAAWYTESSTLSGSVNLWSAR